MISPRLVRNALSAAKDNPQHPPLPFREKDPAAMVALPHDMQFPVALELLSPGEPERP
jgi:hypothetical protein